jgi:hypothetical protein
MGPWPAACPLTPAPSRAAATQVQLLGGEDSAVAAVVSYVRLVQVLDASGKHATTATQVRRRADAGPCLGWPV